MGIAIDPVETAAPKVTDDELPVGVAVPVAAVVLPIPGAKIED